MSVWMDRVAGRIKRFVENPIVNLLKGVVLVVIGFSDASHTLRDDITNGQFRLGHGLVIIGVFSVLGALPHLIEGLEAGERFLESRRGQERGDQGAERP